MTLLDFSIQQKQEKKKRKNFISRSIFLRIDRKEIIVL